MKAYMGLTCKPGSYNEVLRKLLLELHIDQHNVFLLFGPVDILIQFPNLKNLQEFTEKWFNPIRMIGAEEDLISKTVSLVAVSEGPKIVEKPFAFIFLNTKPKSLEVVRTKLLSIEEVLSADSVLGPFDLICSVKAADPDELETLVSVIQQIPGIESSSTSIVSPIRVLPDW
jgi:DNA-binding Lrp family transcriptional regulator